MRMLASRLATSAASVLSSCASSGWRSGRMRLSGAAMDNLNKSSLDELVVTDTIALSPAAQACSKIRQLSVAELLAESIRRMTFGESVSSLYVD